MADKETSDLTAANALDGTELVHIVQGGNSRQATVNQILAAGGSDVPTKVQGKISALADISAGLSLDAAPTEGNVLIAIMLTATSASFPVVAAGWTVAYTNSSVPDVSIAYRTVGAGETALQQPTTTVDGGAIAIYEVSGSLAVIHEGPATNTGTTATVNFANNAEYLPSSAGFGIVYGGRRDVQAGSFSGSATDDLNATGSVGLVGGTGISLNTGTFTLEKAASPSATDNWSTSSASRAGFILAA